MEAKITQLIFEPLLAEPQSKQKETALDFEAEVERKIVKAMTAMLVERFQKGRTADERQA